MQKIDPAFVEVKNLTEDIDLTSFCCSEEELNEYLRDYALRDQTYLYSVTKIVEYKGKIIGYFTLVADTISPKLIDEYIGKKYEYSKLPALKIARLATDKECAGMGVGRFMMEHIFLIVLDIIDDIGCRVITVDAKKDAQGFYEHFAFSAVKSKKMYDTTPMYIDISKLI